jgi:hypothetical protein
MVHAYCDTVQQETVRTGPDISSLTAPPGSLLESVFLLVFDRLPTDFLSGHSPHVYASARLAMSQYIA